MNKQKQLDKISDEIKACKICPIDKQGVPVVGEGNPDADVVFIGEAPGKQEAIAGRPFIGRSGKLLRGLIRDTGLTEDEVYITSPVKYLPNRPARQLPDGSRRLAGGGTPTSSDIAHGRLHLMKQLDIIDPKIIVLLGRVAAEGVLEEKVAVASIHGRVIEKDGKKYMLMFHPAAALRFRKNLLPLQDDFKKLKELLQLK